MFLAFAALGATACSMSVSYEQSAYRCDDGVSCPSGFQCLEIVSDQGDDVRRQLELDWFLQIRSKLATGPLERRRDKVTCRLERKKKRWKVVSLEPVKFFAPPKV